MQLDHRPYRAARAARSRAATGRRRPAGACARCATGCGSSTAGPSPTPHRRPLDELILTVLSQSTNDRNRDVAFHRLRARFPTWTAVREAPLEEVEAAIRPGGISKVKSERIQAILRELPTRRRSTIWRR